MLTGIYKHINNVARYSRGGGVREDRQQYSSAVMATDTMPWVGYKLGCAVFISGFTVLKKFDCNN